MVKPRIVRKDGKRYVQVGRKRIKVASSITERELLKWIIKYLRPKRRNRKSKTIEPFNSVGVAQYAAREKIERQSEQLKQLEHKVEKAEKASIGEEMIPKSKVLEFAKAVDNNMYKRIKDNENAVCKRLNLHCSRMKSPKSIGNSNASLQLVRRSSTKW